MISDINYNGKPGCILDAYLPDAKAFPVVVWFHGGGLESFDRNSQELAPDFVRHGCAFVTADYRKYPDAHFPDFIRDATDAVAWTVKKFPDSKIIVTGQSAGAYLAAMLFANPEYLRSAGVSYEAVSGYVCDSAQLTDHFNILRERGIDTRFERIDEAAPMFFINGDAKFRPIRLIYYTNDIVCRREQNLLFFKSLGRISPDTDAKLIELEGKHVSGSYIRDARGEFPFVTETLDFIGGL